MPSIQIKDVPAETHAVYRRRAAQAHQSLQEYLLSKLIADAGVMTTEEWLAEAGSDSGGSITFEEAARLVRLDRDSR